MALAALWTNSPGRRKRDPEAATRDALDPSRAGLPEPDRPECHESADETINPLRNWISETDSHPAAGVAVLGLEEANAEMKVIRRQYAMAHPTMLDAKPKT